MPIELHQAKERGQTKTPWLTSFHSFSFNEYYNPNRTNFGKLIVLNDDIIAPGKGFPLHGHQNMEIITLVTKGELAHQDSTGGKGVIKPGEVQVMSAGTGVRHSEFNNSKTEPVHLFQIWIEPQKYNLKPRYTQAHYDLQVNQPLILASNLGQGLPIMQDAKISLLDLEPKIPITFTIPSNHGLYLFVIQGESTILDETLKERDALAITDINSIIIKAKKSSKILLLDVPV